MKYLFGLFTACMLMSCGSNKNYMNNNSTLQDKWELISMNGDDVSINSPVTIEFNQKNQFFGYAGCNNINGNYSYDDSGFKFDKISSTRMMCSEEVNNFEYKFITNLEKANNLEIDGENLVIKNGDDEMIFHKIMYPELSGKTWIFENDVKDMQDVENTTITLKSNNEITGFNGCNHFFGSYKIGDDNKIEIDSNLSISAKLCDGVDDQSFMEILNNAKSFKISEGKLYLMDANDNVIGTFK